MKLSPIRLAFTALASLALATSADAATILVFGQSNTSTEVVTSTATGGTTTFSSGPGVPATPITVGVTNIGGVTPPPGTTLPETFSFTSSQAVTGSAGNFTQGGFSGTFSFGNQIVGTLTGGVLTTTTGPAGSTGSFLANNVTFTTLGAGILAQLGNPPLNLVNGTIAISLANISFSGTSISFTAQNSGLVTANVIPEPASIVMAGMAVVAGLGGMGLRRIKAARA